MPDLHFYNMYKEEQKLNSKLVAVVLVASALVVLAGISMMFWQGASLGNDELLKMMFPVIAVVIIVMILVYFLIFKTTLEINIDANGITYRYFPFVPRSKTITYDTINSWQQRRIKNMFDYGGYGYQKDIFQKKTGFILQGKEIFELRLSNGNKIAFTAADKTMMLAAMKKYLPNKQII